jgi:hypothetical protein
MKTNTGRENVVTAARSSNKFPCATGLHISALSRLGCRDGTVSRSVLSLCTLGAQMQPLLPCNFSGLIDDCATSLHNRPPDAPGRAITRYQRIQGNRAFSRCHSFALSSPTIRQASRVGQESFCRLSRPTYHARGHFIRYDTRGRDSSPVPSRHPISYSPPSNPCSLVSLICVALASSRGS